MKPLNRFRNEKESKQKYGRIGTHEITIQRITRTINLRKGHVMQTRQRHAYDHGRQQKKNGERRYEGKSSGQGQESTEDLAFSMQVKYKD